MWVDGMYIPKDAKHKDNAYLFINYILRPDVMADITNEVNYANANGGSWPLIDPEVRNDEAVFPSEATMQTLFATTAEDPKKERLRLRAFIRAKSGM